MKARKGERVKRWSGEVQEGVKIVLEESQEGDGQE